MMKHDFNFTVTGIGSVPFLNINETCRLICEIFPEIPFWPQFVKRSIYEDMIIQFSEGLPFEISKDKRALIVVKDDNFQKKLLAFYEAFLAEKLESFSISYEFAPGLYEMVKLIKDKNTHFIKGQSVGPITFAASINDQDGKAIINDPELMDVCSKGIAIKGLWHIKKLKESGKEPVLFFDEPYLSNIGSAFSTISRQDVINILRELIGYIKEKEDVLIGIHCCGNTDWSMIVETSPDIISFDAFNYMEHFLLYKDNIMDFIRDGGILAWGLVPTTDIDFIQMGNPDMIFSKIKNAISIVNKWGIEMELIYKNSILTPSCGMGTMKIENARKALELLLELYHKILHKPHNK